jgi:phosphorylase kinase alpha/beta subunit
METRYDAGLMPFVQTRYTKEVVVALRAYLSTQGTFDFQPYSSGLYPATSSEESEKGRYRYAWVRDNVHVAHALLRAGRAKEAVPVVRALVQYFETHAERFEACIDGRVDIEDPMNRPHVRVNGETLEEVTETWPHAQNDAHGLFLWITGMIVREGLLGFDPALYKVISRTIRFLIAIRFFEDSDSGAWEERRAVRASSIGAVCAGLVLWRDELHNLDHTLAHSIDHVLEEGMSALNSIVPFETRTEGCEREYDSALLFLVEPLGIVSDAQADMLVERIRTHLMGEKGISRYKKDAFWGPNYQTLPSDLRTSDASEGASFREKYAVSGKEAQWTIFDPLLALHFAKRYQKYGHPEHAELSAIHLNRTLAMLVRTQENKLLLPELYYYKEDVLVPNTIVPLYWAQANLLLALSEMKHIF